MNGMGGIGPVFPVSCVKTAVPARTAVYYYGGP